jgi:hypothetical protein
MYGRKYMGVERSAVSDRTERQARAVWYKISPKDTPLNLLDALGLK